MAAAGPGDAVLVGVVRDGDGQAIEGAVVVARGDKLQGKRMVVTDVSGIYRISDLPPGVYELAVVHQRVAAMRRYTGLHLRASVTVRVDVSLVRSREVLVVDVPAPTVAAGSSTNGVAVDRETIRRVPIAAPTGKGGANRSFEALAEAAPGARSDTYGTSIAGTTSPENRYSIDGLVVNDPAVGIVGTPLSAEFVEEVRVELGGYMPEHGRSTGGILQAGTKTGSNEFHGGVYAYYTPGRLEGRREVPRAEGQTVVTERNLGWIGDAGFDLGGRLIKDRLWFYGGVNVARTAYDLESSWNRISVGPDGQARVDPDTQRQQTERIAGSTRHDRASGTTVQALAKLTYSPSPRHTLELLGIHVPQMSGGRDTYGLNARMGVPDVGHIIGDHTALTRRYRDNATDALLTWNARTHDSNWNFSTMAGWHHQRSSGLPVDGSGIGSGTGLAATPGVIYRRTDDLNEATYREAHSITDFVPLPAGVASDACDPAPFTTVDPSSQQAERRSVVCPVSQWFRNGPGFIYDRRLDRGQIRHVATRVVRGAGHHVIKFGIDFEYLHYANDRGYSGGTLYRESTNGASFAEYRQYGYLRGPDDPVVLDSLNRSSSSIILGGFLQDSWTIMDRVTVNAGVRYDMQYTFSGEGLRSLALPNQIAPRFGLAWDPSQSGRSRLFVSYARYYQNIMLSLADPTGSGGEPLIRSSHAASGCDPAVPDQGCDNDSRLLNGADSPSQQWEVAGAGPVPVDPRLRPPSSDEIGGGGEVELFPDARLGVGYTYRRLGRTIEDMSRDEASTYFIGNPGLGVASDFPRAVRVYHAATLLLDKRFSRRWLVSGSYTLAWLRGNISGLFRPENTQLNPNMNTDFDLRSLLDNRTGDLPGDVRHSVKLFAAGDIALPNSQAIRLGGAVRVRSGGPTNYLGAHSIYGHSEAFILPRGAGERLPWVTSLDPSVGYTKTFKDQVALSLTVDVFNALNFQQVLAVDERYTNDEVVPIAGGTPGDLRGLQNTDGMPVAVNPNFGRPTAYQSPRTFRFGVRMTF